MHWISIALATILSGCSPKPAAEWDADSAIVQLRWPLEERVGYGEPKLLDAWRKADPVKVVEQIRSEATTAGRDTACRTIEALAMDMTSRPQAVEILRLLASEITDQEISESLTLEGPRDSGAAIKQWERDKVDGKVVPMRAEMLRNPIRYRVWDHAMLYLLTGNKEDLDQVRKVLLRMAEVVPQWPLYYEAEKKERPRAQNTDEEAYFYQTRSGGIWGVWPALELGVDLPLLRSYDIVRPTLSSTERLQIENNFLVHHKRLMERFSGFLPYGKYPRYHNTLGYHLQPLIRFGWVLGRPDFINEAESLLQNLMCYSYSADGFFREITPSYHQQITASIQAIPQMLKNGSTLGSKTAQQFKRIQAALDVLALPDGYYVALNDSIPKKLRVPGNVKADTPGLLGVSGVAKLGVSGMAVFLDFGGIRGHDHKDALNLTWFAGGREIFSETGYRPLHGSDATREWISSTAAHNTVAVDEQSHLLNQDQLVIPDKDSRTAFNSYPPDVPGTYAGKAPAEAALPGAAAVSNQGRLLLWDGSHPEVQAMEAEQENAYPKRTSLFRRTIILVPLGDGEGYLVDLFRIRGGSIHDYFLRGGLDESYSLDFDLPLRTVERTLYGDIKIHQSAPVDRPLLATAHYPDGWKTISRLAGVFGSEPSNLVLLAGEAPAIRQTGLAPFSILRRSGANPLETCFAFVHETGAGPRHVQNVQVKHDGLDVVVVVDREGGRDIFFSGLSDDSRFEFEGLEFQGRLAVMLQGKPIVFSGSALKQQGVEIAAFVPIALGEVLSTTRKDAQNDRDSLLVRTVAPPSNFRIAHIDIGEVIRFSIPVLRVEKEGENLRVELAHSPGFEIENGQCVMTNFPGWRVFSPATVRLE